MTKTENPQWLIDEAERIYPHEGTNLYNHIQNHKRTAHIRARLMGLQDVERVAEEFGKTVFLSRELLEAAKQQFLDKLKTQGV